MKGPPVGTEAVSTSNMTSVVMPIPWLQANGGLDGAKHAKEKQERSLLHVLRSLNLRLLAVRVYTQLNLALHISRVHLMPPPLTSPKGSQEGTGAWYRYLVCVGRWLACVLPLIVVL